MAKDPLISPRSAALSGMVGPVLFAGGLATLTTLEYGFLLEIGWEPLNGCHLPALMYGAAMACALWKNGCASFGALAAVSGDRGNCERDVSKLPPSIYSNARNGWP